MFRVTKILVPTDFSECAAAALAYAGYLGEKFSSALEVVHIWEPPRYVIPEVAVQLPGQETQTLAEFAQAEAEREMFDFLNETSYTQNVMPTSRLESGDPTEIILSIAERELHDLIVMGTHGRTGLSHLFLGSVAERVVRRAVCPVLTIRHRSDKEAPQP